MMKKDEYSIAFTVVDIFEDRDTASDSIDEIRFDLEMMTWRIGKTQT